MQRARLSLHPMCHFLPELLLHMLQADVSVVKPASSLEMTIDTPSHTPASNDQYGPSPCCSATAAWGWAGHVPCA